MNKSKKYFIIIETVLGLMVLILGIIMLSDRTGNKLGRVSVIVRDSDDAQWAAFKYGIRMAAADRGVEAVIVGTESVLTAEEEEQLLESEINNGADALIVQPIPGEDTADMLKRIRKRVPVMLTEQLSSENGEASMLPVAGADNYALGAALAGELLEDYSSRLEGKTVGILSRTTDSDMTVSRMTGFCETLKGTGAEVKWQVAGNFDNGEGDYLENQARVDFVIALDDSSLTSAGEELAAGGLYGALLYGIGHSTQAAYYVDKGIVECLAVPDEFSIGYQSVNEIADKLEHPFYKMSSQTVSYTMLRRETLFQKENQELLFTMSQ